jgi:hypothetical protein
MTHTTREEDAEIVTRRENVDEYTVRQLQPASDLVRAEQAAMFKLDQALWLLLGVIEALIAIRVVLKLMAANPNSGFAALIYAITAPLLAPFAGLTATPSAAGAVLEIPALIAMVIYALFFWFLVRLLHFILERP